LTSLTIVVAALVAALVAWIGARVLARTATRNGLAIDDTLGEIRKIHVMPTSRIGGIALAAGIVAGALYEYTVEREIDEFWVLILCAAPGFLWGLIEDVSKRGAVAARLAITALGAALAFVLVDARITQLDVPGLDWLLMFHLFSFALTVFAVTGVTHSINVIDGLNGLAGFVSLLAAVGLAVVAAITDDQLVFPGACVLAASILGFLVVNFPRGRIFLGDGGAYFVGLMLAELSVLLVHRNSEVSPWFPLVLLAYPIWETLFSMYRRRMRGQSTGQADALHLHSLVYHRLVRWHGHAGSAADYVTRNSIASLLLWAVPVACFAVAVRFWDGSRELQVAAAAFGIIYILVYRRLVRFGVPAWLVIRARAKPKAVAEMDGDTAEV
jgi:UDP-GlcNAc:undecaprenyl-phosphate/decaprenyl-phosphate GlcNAc-1-phosphate transferase